MEKLNISFHEIVKLLTDTFTNWFEAGVRAFPNFLVAIIVMVVFIILSKLAKSSSERILFRFTNNSSVVHLGGSLSKIMVFAIGLSTCLGILNLEKTVTSLLAGAGVLGLALGFAFQEISANFIAGVIVAFRKPFEIGQIIEVDGVMGTVARQNLRTTVIETFHGQIIYVPNKKLITENIVNYEEIGRRMIELEVGVAYDSPLEKVVSLAHRALQRVDCLVSDQEIQVFFREFGASSINFIVRYWVHYPGQANYFRSTHQAIIAIKKIFDEENINIPFPIRTLDFNEKSMKVLENLN